VSETRTRNRVRALLKAGAHLLVVSTRDKAAIKTAWQRPENRLNEGQAFTRARRHGFKALGIIPRSIGCVVIDVDEGGDAAKDWLLGLFPGAHAHPSSRAGRWHVWVWTDAPEIGNYSWKSRHGAGQFRHGHGYVVLWSPGTVARWLVERTRPAPVEDVQNFVRHHQASLVPSRSGETVPLDLDQIEAADWSEGNRNNTLNALAYIACAHGEGLDALREHAIGVGLTEEEVDKTLASAERAGGTARADVLADLPVLKPGPEKNQPKLCIVEQQDPQGLRKALDWIKVQPRWNERALQLELSRDGGPWFPVDDMIRAHLRWEIRDKCFVRMKKGPPGPLLYPQAGLADLLNVLLHDRRVDPFREWLDSLPTWDGKDRISHVLTECFAAEPTPLHQWASRFLTLGAVHRAFRPGCKLDEMPVLIGEQGFGKSSILEHLFPHEHRQWYAPGLKLSAGPKERVEALQRRVLVEASDMAGADRADLKSLNAFLTQTDDGSVRLAYRRDPEVLLRRCIIIGTADDPNCLPNDPAGLRRFVPVQLHKGTNVEAWLEEHRENLWAEALHRFREGEGARLPRSLIMDQRYATERHRRTAEVLEQRLTTLDIEEGTLADIAVEVGLAETVYQAARLSPRDTHRLIAALRVLGWTRHKKRLGRTWRKPWNPDDLL